MGLCSQQALTGTSEIKPLTWQETAEIIQSKAIVSLFFSPLALTSTLAVSSLIHGP